MHKDLLKSQMTEKKAQIEVLDGQIVKAEKEKDTIQAELNRIEKLLPSVEERIEKKRILVDEKLLARLTAEIKTGKRRVIEYLLSPVMKYLNESLKER